MQNWRLLSLSCLLAFLALLSVATEFWNVSHLEETHHPEEIVISQRNSIKENSTWYRHYQTCLTKPSLTDKYVIIAVTDHYRAPDYLPTELSGIFPSSPTESRCYLLIIMQTMQADLYENVTVIGYQEIANETNIPTIQNIAMSVSILINPSLKGIMDFTSYVYPGNKAVDVISIIRQLIPPSFDVNFKEFRTPQEDLSINSNLFNYETSANSDYFAKLRYTMECLPSIQQFVPITEPVALPRYYYSESNYNPTFFSQEVFPLLFLPPNHTIAISFMFRALVSTTIMSYMKVDTGIRHHVIPNDEAVIAEPCMLFTPIVGTLDSEDVAGLSINSSDSLVEFMGKRERGAEMDLQIRVRKSKDPLSVLDLLKQLYDDLYQGNVLTLQDYESSLSWLSQLAISSIQLPYVDFRDNRMAVCVDFRTEMQFDTFQLLTKSYSSLVRDLILIDSADYLKPMHTMILNSYKGVKHLTCSVSTSGIYRHNCLQECLVEFRNISYERNMGVLYLRDDVFFNFTLQHQNWNYDTITYPLFRGMINMLEKPVKTGSNSALWEQMNDLYQGWPNDWRTRLDGSFGVGNIPTDSPSNFLYIPKSHNQWTNFIETYESAKQLSGDKFIKMQHEVITPTLVALTILVSGAEIHVPTAAEFEQYRKSVRNINTDLLFEDYLKYWLSKQGLNQTTPIVFDPSIHLWGANRSNFKPIQDMITRYNRLNANSAKTNRKPKPKPKPISFTILQYRLNQILRALSLKSEHLTDS